MDRSNFLVQSQAHITEWGNVGVILQIDTHSRDARIIIIPLCTASFLLTNNFKNLFLTHTELIKWKPSVVVIGIWGYKQLKF